MLPIAVIFAEFNQKAELCGKNASHAEPFPVLVGFARRGNSEYRDGNLLFCRSGGFAGRDDRIFIAVLVVAGIVNVFWAFANREWNDSWGWSLARGLLEILFGVWLLLMPLPLVTTMLIYVVGFWMLFHSVLGICEASELSGIGVRGWGWLLACNILSLICSFVFLAAPVYGGIFILAYAGVSFVLYGIFRIVLSFEWRRINRKIRSSDDDGFAEAEVIDD